MSRLLSASFTRLWKNAVFYVGLIFMVFYALFLIMARGNEDVDTPILLHALIIPIVIAVFVSLFIGTEYGDGTIRNKLIVGHSRASIYFSNLIVCTVAGALMNIVYMLTVIAFMFVSSQNIVIEKELFICILCSFVTVTAFISLFLMMSMLIQSKAVGAVAALVSCFVLLFAAMNISSALSSPEYYGAYTYTDEEGEEIKVESEINPYYLRGTKRKVYEFLWEYLPYCQMGRLQAQVLETGPIVKMPLYALSLIVITTSVGVVVFYKKDLK